MKVYFPDQHPPNGIYNSVYSSVRQILSGLGLHSENIGTEQWNPLASFLSRGEMVLLKPNLVHDYNVIRPLIEYVAETLEYDGTIFIAGAPLQSCDFRKLRVITRIDEQINVL